MKLPAQLTSATQFLYLGLMDHFGRGAERSQEPKESDVYCGIVSSRNVRETAPMKFMNMVAKT